MATSYTITQDTTNSRLQQVLTRNSEPRANAYQKSFPELVKKVSTARKGVGMQF